MLERIPFALAHALRSSVLFLRQFSRSNWIGLIGIGLSHDHRARLGQKETPQGSSSSFCGGEGWIVDWLAAERAELEFDRPRLLPGLNGYAGVAACMTSIGAEKMTQNTVGVDISKHWLDAHRLIDGASRRFNNDRAGRKALIAWARRPGPDPRLAFEPSGGYHRELEQAFDQAGVAAVKINPLQARRFAEAIGIRAKTDAVDARVLARMAAVLELQATPAPTEIMRQLKELLVARRALIKDQTAAGARANSLISPLLKRLSDARRRHLEAQLQAVEAEIDALIGADPGLAARRDILMSIPGISDVTATALLIEAPELGSLEAGQAASLAGLAPMTRQSGQWTGRAAIRGGRAPLRRALYMPALVAARHNPDLKTVYDRLIAAGKPPKLALTALMRKLVILANALLRDARKWAPNTA
jgi:transposase